MQICPKRPLEGHVELVPANVARVRNAPGRKADVTDATLIAELLAHGLITVSMTPSASIQELCDLTLARKQVVRDIGQHTQSDVLKDTNLKRFIQFFCTG